MKKIAIAALLVGCSAAHAQVNGSTASTAQQQSSINNQVVLGSGGESDVGYHGSYTVRSAPTVYAPSLTASMTETCWGSVSGAVSVVGVGATAAATIKDLDCNRRLNASVAWKMDRKDIAFNLMCQDDDFRAAAEGTATPCRPKPGAVVAAQPAPGQLNDPIVLYHHPEMASK